MSTDDKTTAGVQPAERVRLGYQAERARFDEFLSRNPLMALCAGTAWQVWQAALSAQPSLGGQDARRCADHCQNGRADFCLASQRDGVICPEDSCDIDDGIRHNRLAARQRLNGLSWADYWMGRGQPAVAHDFDAFSRAEAWALQHFHDARRPVDLTAAQAVAVYDAVTRRNFTRDVKSPEDKARTVTAALIDSLAVDI